MSFDNSFFVDCHLSMWKCSSVYNVANMKDFIFSITIVPSLDFMSHINAQLHLFWYLFYSFMHVCHICFLIIYVFAHIFLLPWLCPNFFMQCRIFCLMFIMLISSSVLQSFSLYTDFFGLIAFPDVIKLLLMCSSYTFHFQVVHIPVFNVFV